MAKEKIETPTVEEPQEFPLTAEEFCFEKGKSNVESQYAFCRVAGGGAKLRGEWQQLFDHFMNRPISTPWEEWLKTFQGGN